MATIAALIYMRKQFYIDELTNKITKNYHNVVRIKKKK